MARIVDENFEGTGYEESWSETVGTGCTLDEDAAIPGTAPNGAGSQCLKSIIDTGVDAAYATRTPGDNNIIYARTYVYFDTMGMASGEYIAVMTCRNSGGSACFQVRATNTAGTKELKFLYYSGGSLLTAASTHSITTGVWYRVEVRYDITNMLWEWRVNGTTKDSGSLTAATRTPNRLQVGADQTGSGSTTSTVYHDLVVWDNATWPGEEAGGGGLSIPVAMHHRMIQGMS